MKINKRGFTLIELLIVVAIIGILSVALVPTGMNALKKSRDGTRIANVEAIAKVMQEYALDGNDLLVMNKQESPYGRLVFGSTANTLAPNNTLRSYFKGSILPNDPSGTHKFINSNTNSYKGDYYVATINSQNGGSKTTPRDALMVCSTIELYENANCTQYPHGLYNKKWDQITFLPADEDDSLLFILC
jgi:prepilin-type N-terminal cleavage/methylation domain-containing protein